MNDAFVVGLITTTITSIIGPLIAIYASKRNEINKQERENAERLRDRAVEVAQQEVAERQAVSAERDRIVEQYRELLDYRDAENRSLRNRIAELEGRHP